MNKWLAFFIPGVFLVCLGLTLMFYRLVTNGLSVDFILDIFFSLFLLGPGAWLILTSWQDRGKARKKAGL
jgi:hypothetical protein